MDTLSDFEIDWDFFLQESTFSDVHLEQQYSFKPQYVNQHHYIHSLLEILIMIIWYMGPFCYELPIKAVGTGKESTFAWSINNCHDIHLGMGYEYRSIVTSL